MAYEHPKFQIDGVAWQSSSYSPRSAIWWEEEEGRPREEKSERTMKTGVSRNFLDRKAPDTGRGLWALTKINQIASNRKEIGLPALQLVVVATATVSFADSPPTPPLSPRFWRASNFSHAAARARRPRTATRPCLAGGPPWKRTGRRALALC
jgi:hypothetical protein